MIIFFPPQFEPFQAYLAGAALKPAVEAKGIGCRYVDLNLAYYHRLLGDVCDELVSSCRERAFRLEGFKRRMDVMNAALRHGPTSVGMMGFYDARFGDALYDPNYLGEIVRGEWGQQFERFLREYFIQHPLDGDLRFAAVTLVVHDQLPASMVLSRFLREAAPRAQICWGGPLISRVGEAIAAAETIWPFFDTMVLGAGEDTLPALIRAELDGGIPLNLTGVIRSGQPVCKVGLAPPPGDFLLPDFSSYPLNEYLSPMRVLPFLTSRGCYWGKCEFCCHYLPFEKYQTDTVNPIVDQLQLLSEDYDTKYFSFSDECIPVKMLKRLSGAILERGLNIRWFTFARMEPGFDEDTCRLLYRAGCRILMFGFESAVQRVLDAMTKGTRVEHVLPILRACREAGISIRLDVLIGFPTETHDESEQTLAFLMENRDLIDTPFSVTPLSKFELHGDAPMRSRLREFGVRSGGALRGPLDYQHRYSVECGMGPLEAEEQYRRFIEVISKEYRAHGRMPESKTHAFLMKSYYSDNRLEDEVFADEICAADLSVCRFIGHEDLEISDAQDGTWVLAHRGTGAKLKIGRGLADAAAQLQEYGRLLDVPEPDSRRAKEVAKFLTYLGRHGFLSVQNTAATQPEALLRV